MAKPRLHLDADTSKKSLLKALVEQGYDVTRTPNEWIALDADDIEQLLGATPQGRVIFTFNVRDFMELAKTLSPSCRYFAIGSEANVQTTLCFGADVCRH